MALFIVADGGGTKTELVLVNDTGKVLQHRISGGSNPIFMDLDRALCQIREPIESMLGAEKIEAAALSKMLLMIPGMRTYTDRLQQYFPTTEIEVVGDEISALYGGLGQADGVVLLSGTGSFATGRINGNRTASVGGWGSLFGDGGSGYSIGLNCLRAVTKRYDDGLGNSAMTEAVLKFFEVTELTKLRSLQSQTQLFSRERIASLTRQVAACAAQGDADALWVLEQAAEDLSVLAGQCSNKLGLDIKQRYPCVLMGGVAQIGQPLLEPLREHLMHVSPHLELTQSRLKPIAGAVLFLLSKQGKITPEILKNIYLI